MPLKGSGKKKVKAKEAADTEDAITVMSLRLDTPLYHRLRQLSFDRHQSMKDFIVQGIEQVLKAEKY